VGGWDGRVDQWTFLDFGVCDFWCVSGWCMHICGGYLGIGGDGLEGSFGSLLCLGLDLGLVFFPLLLEGWFAVILRIAAGCESGQSKELEKRD